MPDGLEVCGAPLWESRPVQPWLVSRRNRHLAGLVGREAPWEGPSELLGRWADWWHWGVLDPLKLLQRALISDVPSVEC